MGLSSDTEREWLRKQVEKFSPGGWEGPAALEIAVEELRAVGLDRLLRHFSTFLADPDPQIRSAATQAILSMKDPNSITLVLPFLEDPDQDVRWVLCEMLYRHGDHRAIGPLIERMKHDSDPAVRTSAAMSLGGIGSPVAIPDLIHAMENDFELDELGYSASHTAKAALDKIMDTEHTRIKIAENLNKLPSTMPDPARIKREALAFYEEYLKAKSCLSVTGEDSKPLSADEFDYVR